MTRRLRILVVDDDEDNALSLGELFEMDGHEVEVVHSGEAAIAAFDRTSFDITFMDVMMPGRNGVESFLEIRKRRPEARVCMMTGYSVEELLRQATDNGAMGVLSKPLDLAKVQGVLADVGNSGIVVVADDDPDLGPDLQRLIVRSGRPCRLIRDDCESVDCAGPQTAGVVIYDLKAPLIRGVECYSRMRQAGRVSPTIIITRRGPQYHDTLAAMRDVAVTGILSKPFDPMGLLLRLEQLAAPH